VDLSRFLKPKNQFTVVKVNFQYLLFSKNYSICTHLLILSVKNNFPQSHYIILIYFDEKESFICKRAFDIYTFQNYLRLGRGGEGFSPVYVLVCGELLCIANCDRAVCLRDGIIMDAALFYAERSNLAEADGVRLRRSSGITSLCELKSQIELRERDERRLCDDSATNARLARLSHRSLFY